jgi:N utilization substance protein A
LAARLIGWKIDIKSETRAAEIEQEDLVDSDEAEVAAPVEVEGDVTATVEEGSAVVDDVEVDVVDDAVDE